VLCFRSEFLEQLLGVLGWNKRTGLEEIGTLAEAIWLRGKEHVEKQNWTGWNILLVISETLTVKRRETGCRRKQRTEVDGWEAGEQAAVLTQTRLKQTTAKPQQ
jgi:hypothetical protein